MRSVVPTARADMVNRHAVPALNTAGWGSTGRPRGSGTLGTYPSRSLLRIQPLVVRVGTWPTPSHMRVTSHPEPDGLATIIRDVPLPMLSPPRQSYALLHPRSPRTLISASFPCVPAEKMYSDG